VQAALLALAAFLLLPQTALAHVKWFSDFSFTDRPLTLDETITPLFIGLAVLSMVVIGALVVVDRLLKDTTWYNRIGDWLEERSDKSVLVMRVATGATLLMSWQADALLVPELTAPAAWVGWAQFVVALLLLFRETTPIAGVGLIGLYVIGIVEYRAFHMLDYLLFLGVAWFLIVSTFKDQSIYGTGIPALYATVGFSLFWVGLEKLIYPQWSLYILEQNPQLALGLPLEFFLTSAAFVELSLGFLLIIGLLGRPLSLVVTLVFFSTTLVFGKVEVIGHTIIHGALIVFLLEGPGPVYKAPYQFLKSIPQRTAFASLSFALVLVALLLPYTFGAQQVWQNASAEAAYPHQEDLTLQTVEGEASVDIDIHRHDEHYAFDMTHEGDGQPLLMINGYVVGTVEGEHVDLPALDPGIYEVSLLVVQGEPTDETLTAITDDGVPIVDVERVVVEAPSAVGR
jgi:uncharacterized membrane protein YphA (DoxX/SURF4 family)